MKYLIRIQKVIVATCLLLSLSFTSVSATDLTPVIHFSDLISGPDTGLGDGLGSGVIVTIWGQNLGETIQESTITFKDSENNIHYPYVYYWKSADGDLPGGPANLYESHKMQEIAISIPDSSIGLGEIYVTVSGESSNTLPFTVRPGNIYHVMPSGNDSSNDGTFSSPWATVSKGDGFAGAGDTLYIHDVATGGPTKRRPIYNNRGFKATTANQFAYVAYPNTRPTVTGGDGVWMYLTTGIVTSKLMVYASNCDAQAKNCFQKGTNGIAPSDWGRVIGNAITDQSGGCAKGQAGAISGGVNRVEGAKIFGNYIYDYSCPEASKLHHTTYMTIRGDPDDPQIEAWEFGWNYLKDNDAKNGIHNYDEDNSGANACGDMTTDLLIHDNVIVNQAGAGITIESVCGWTQDTYIYNNVLINVGLPSDINCKSNCGVNTSAINVVDGFLSGTVNIHNNTIYGWDSENFPGTSNACLVIRGKGDSVTVLFNDNICFTATDKPFSLTSLWNNSNFTDNVSGSGNNWYYSGSTSPTNAIAPSWDTAPIAGDPKLTVQGSRIMIGALSAVRGKSNTTLERGIYGTLRGDQAEVGSVEYVIPVPQIEDLVFTDDFE